MPYARGMFYVRILIVAAIVYFVYIVARQLISGTRRSRFKCATCKSCGKLFDDGVICRFAGRETFKNETHIGNCIDYEKR